MKGAVVRDTFSEENMLAGKETAKQTAIMVKAEGNARDGRTKGRGRHEERHTLFASGPMLSQPVFF